jgi:Protein of unknown function (DUF1552)
MRRIDRRTLLRGAGFSMALPLLEVMSNASLFGRPSFASEAAKLHPNLTANGRPVRMACLFVPNGVIQPAWRPEGTETDWKLSPTLEPLSAVKDKLNVIRQLAHDNGRAYRDGAGDHARSGSVFLTGARPTKTSSNIRLGVSVDQLAATALAGETKLPSIELGLEGSRNAGSCDSGYSCAYSSNISWRNETTPMPKETVPQAAFDRLFGSGDAAQQRRLRRSRESILDVVSADAEKLMKQVGRTDRMKLDEYFTSVREIERQIERTDDADRAALPDLDVPEGRVDAFAEHIRLMFDLMVIAFQTDTTRVATLMFDNAGGNRVYREIGVNDAHHGMSHHRDKPNTVADLKKVDRYLIQQLAYFLEKLDSIPDGEGTLLDQSMVLYGSGLGDGNRHTHDDLPILLAGGAGGRLSTGRLIDLQDETPMSNLFLSMLDMMGTPAQSIGNSTGPLKI